MKISVCMITYNHEKYIGQAIESVMTQETGFPFELVVSDDGSTDATGDIILRLQEKYPGKIRAFLNKTNTGVMPNFMAALKACRGQYIALLEGDDYWTDPEKLKTQAAILDTMPDISFCSHNAEVIYEDIAKPPHPFNSRKPPTVSTINDLIDTWWYTQTGTMVFRREHAQELPGWFPTILNGDFALGLVLALHGKIYYIDKVMSVYRRHKCGFSNCFDETFNSNLSSVIDILDKFNEYSGYAYSREISRRITILHKRYVEKAKRALENKDAPLWEKKKTPQEKEPTVGHKKLSEPKDEANGYNPRVSIITPNYNGGQFLEETILSVIGQNYPNLEFIIIDGGSTDNSVEIIKKYEKYITYWESKKDNGQAQAINTGFSRASGEIMGWINSDDMYLPNTLPYISTRLNLSLSQVLYGECIHISQENPGKVYGSGMEKLTGNPDFLNGSPIQPSTFWTRKAWETVGKLNETLHFAFDLEWYNRARQAPVEFIYAPKQLSIYRFHPSHKTGTAGEKRLREIASIYGQFKGKYYEQALNTLIDKQNQVRRSNRVIEKINIFHGKSFRVFLFRLFFPVLRGIERDDIDVFIRRIIARPSDKV